MEREREREALKDKTRRARKKEETPAGKGIKGRDAGSLGLTLPPSAEEVTSLRRKSIRVLTHL